MKSRFILSILLFFIASIFVNACAQQSPSITSNLSPTSPPDLKSDLSYSIVDTGQTKCYDNTNEITAPSLGQYFYGQDAQTQGNQPSYKDNRDGTIIDLVTGLMWQKTPGNKIGYANAIAGVKSFNLAGYTDWRLPTIKELYSLILFSGMGVSSLMDGRTTSNNLVPFLDTNYFDFKYGDISSGERIIDAQYWSSTEYVSTTMNSAVTAFGVNFADGRIKGYPQQMPRGEFVRYVRGNSSYGINVFFTNNDGTIIDKATGLMWSKEDSGKGMNWQEALTWIQQKNTENYLGHNDWRLPNSKELQSIVDYKRSPATTRSAAINPLFSVTELKDEGGKINYPFYWTSTTHVDLNNRGTFAVYVCFGEALGYMQPPGIGGQMPSAGQLPQGRQFQPGGQQLPNTGNYQLMDVHGAGAQRSDLKIGNPADYPYGHGPQGDVVRIYNYARCVRDSN
jgi:hypothetical protein